MKKIGKVIGKLIVIAVLVAFLYNLAVFAFAKDINAGLWAVMLMLAMRIEINVGEGSL